MAIGRTNISGGGGGIDLDYELKAGSGADIATPTKKYITNHSSMTKMYSFKILMSGSVRLSYLLTAYFEWTEYFGDYNVYSRLYINDIAQGDVKVISTNNSLDITEDINVSKGDEIQIYAYTGRDESYGSEDDISNVKLSVLDSPKLVEVIL